MSEKISSVKIKNRHKKCVNKIVDSRSYAVQTKIISALTNNGCRILKYGEETTAHGRVAEFIPRCGHGTKKITTRTFRDSEVRCSLYNVYLCKKCANKLNRLKMDRSWCIDKIKKELGKRGFLLIDIIPGSHKLVDDSKVVYDSMKVKYRAKCGHVVTMSARSLYANAVSDVCPRCRQKNRKIDSEEKLKNTCKLLGVSLLTYRQEFIGGKYHKSVFCGSCGHTFEMRNSQFRVRNSGLCQNCSKKKLSEAAVKSCASRIFGDKNTVYEMLINTGKTHQFIDVAVSRAKLAIEYNGAQHYENVSFFYGSTSGFERQVERDVMKRKWCKDNGYHLVEIDGRLKKNQLSNLTVERVSEEIEKQTGHSVEYFKKILEDGNAKNHT